MRPIDVDIWKRLSNSLRRKSERQIKHTLDIWIYKWLNKFNEGENSARVPFLPTYEHKWTNDDLFEYFNLDRRD